MPKDPAGKMREAFDRFQAQDLAGAERLCVEILRDMPRYPDALHLLGVVRLATGSAGDAVSLISGALEGKPRDPVALEHLGLARVAQGDYAAAEAAFREAVTLGGQHGLLLMRLGMALAAQGRTADALVALRTAAASSPEIPDIHLNLGNALAERGELDEALACYERVLAMQPDNLHARYNAGNVHRLAGRLEDAVACYKKVLGVAPRDPDTHNNLGLVYQQQGRLDEAAECYRLALAIAPDNIHALSNLGNVLHAQGRLEEAADSCARALTIRADFVDALINLGNVRAAQVRLAEAQALYGRALRVDPRNSDAHRNLGALFRSQGRMKEATECLRKALELVPEQSGIYEDLGSTLRDSGYLESAVAAYRKAIDINPRSASLHYNIAEAFKILGRFDEAIVAYERALEIKPDYLRALGGLAYIRQHVCDWNGIESLWERLRRDAIGRPGSGISPFGVLFMPFSAEEHLSCAKAWARQMLTNQDTLHMRIGNGESPRTRRPRMCVGYLSWDFHQHATSYLMAELFELHDRSQFEVFVYSYGPDDRSAIRARIQAASEHFIDVSGESFVETAQRIRRDEIDILVDLKGYTLGSRPQILALRPAPVQVNWLGFPGSMGTECVDYIIADPYVVPDGAERNYSERVVRLPDCYQVNDRKREVSDRMSTRGENGLPPAGVVLCCFNQTAKILPDVFACWMRIMRAVPGSVLWLLESNRWAAENLRRAAAAHEIAGDRLLFAPRKPLAEHLARYRAADLAIDTFPYTSHTTASDALWAGCPLVTRVGDTFVSRVAGSILRNAGMHELVTDNAGEYERKVIELATAPGKLQDLRRKLRETRDQCPLFDTPRFVRNLESAYEGMLKALRDRGPMYNPSE